VGKAELRAFPQSVMEACYRVAQEMYAELSKKNADFRKIYEPWSRFRDEQYLWFRVAEHTYDNFVYSIRKPGRKP
jgi:TRAP-type mannitol/chloroaromatic compound transport system substrate-binding protein